MTRFQKTSQQRLHRLLLIARVQVASEALGEAVEKARDGSRRTRAALRATRMRLTLLSRALAMLALGPVPVAAALAGALVFTLPSHAALAQGAGDLEAPPPPGDEADEQEAPPEAQRPAQVPDQATFDRQLTPYGRWTEVDGYGRVWVPNAASARADWQPYTDGHWAYTEYGWSFVPDAPWGWAVFHYGRWGYGNDLGWYWIPGFVWAPAWVSWRYSNGHVAWAPYGPAGYRYGNRWPGWVAVQRDHFTHPIAREVIPSAHARPFVRGARVGVSIRSAPEAGHAYGPPRSSVGAFRAGGGGRGGGAPGGFVRGGAPGGRGGGAPAAHGAPGGGGHGGGRGQGGGGKH